MSSDDLARAQVEGVFSDLSCHLCPVPFCLASSSRDGGLLRTKSAVKEAIAFVGFESLNALDGSTGVLYVPKQKPESDRDQPCGTPLCQVEEVLGHSWR